MLFWLLSLLLLLVFNWRKAPITASNLWRSPFLFHFQPRRLGMQHLLRFSLCIRIFRKTNLSRCGSMWKDDQRTQGFKHLHPSILSFKQNSIVEWVEGTAHSHQNDFQAAYQTQKREEVPHINAKHQNIGNFKKIFRETSIIRNISMDTHSWKHLDDMSLNERKTISICFEHRKG